MTREELVRKILNELIKDKINYVKEETTLSEMDWYTGIIMLFYHFSFEDAKGLAKDVAELSRKE